MLSQQKVKTLEKAKEIKDSITDETKRKNIELMEEKY